MPAFGLLMLLPKVRACGRCICYWPGLAHRVLMDPELRFVLLLLTRSEGRLFPGHLVFVAPGRILFTACLVVVGAGPAITDTLLLLLARWQPDVVFLALDIARHVPSRFFIHINQVLASSRCVLVRVAPLMCYPRCAMTGQVLGGKVTPGADESGRAQKKRLRRVGRGAWTLV
jgi:hypothetical protein